MNKQKINYARLKVLLKNGYNTIDIHNQTIICPNGTIKQIPQWDINYYENLHKYQKLRGVV